jgi:hypothetical protein
MTFSGPSTTDKVMAATQPPVLQPQKVSCGVPSFARVLSQDPNGTSSAFDLSECSTATSNTTLGLYSQGPSRN